MSTAAQPTPEQTRIYGNDRERITTAGIFNTGTTRTIRPLRHDTNATFKARMRDLAQQLISANTSTEADLTYEYKDGAITHALLVLTYAPIAIAQVEISADARPAGGRPTYNTTSTRH